MDKPESEIEFVEREWRYLTEGQQREPRWKRLFALARRGAEMQWRPIETAPKREIVAVRYVQGTLRLAYQDRAGNWFLATNEKINTPKWWTPLPPHVQQERRNDQARTD